MIKVLFQRFIDRDGKEVGHKTTERTTGHWAREKFGDGWYTLQWFERTDGGVLVAIYRLERPKELSTSNQQKVELH